MIDGQRLRQLREAYGYNRRELAEQVAIDERHLMRYEQGESDVTADVLARIATTLGVSADYLIRLSDHAAHHLDHGLTSEEASALTAWRLSGSD
jgi:transcriptional regulator with XRE-family HTH domain